MQLIKDTIDALGDEPPLIAGGQSGAPDRREISARWLSGTFLTGITSSVLMGVALFAALDGREQLATPPELLNLSALGTAPRDSDLIKSSRLIAPRAITRSTDRRRMEVSTMLKAGDHDLVRTLPFVQVKMALAAGHTTTRSYPAFDPLDVFAESGATAAAAQTSLLDTGFIYGAKVESEVSLRTIDFPIETASFDARVGLSAEEVETVVRNTAAILTDGAVQVAALHYVDPQRFGETLATQTLSGAYGIRIVQENVSVATRDYEPAVIADYAEDIIPFHAEGDIADTLLDLGYSQDDSQGMGRAFATLLGSPVLKSGYVMRLGVETRNGISRIMRASLYQGNQHHVTVALDDHDQYVKGSEPEPNPGVLTAFDANPPLVQRRSDMPTIYDGIWRAAYSYGMTRPMTRQLMRLLASDVDFQSRLNPNDRIAVFFSQPDEENNATDESELLYVQASIGGTTRSFYRFRMDDGTIDYFDEEGRSARQFLLRNPVPNGRFTSGFGSRRHPILGYSRMHTGVDWAAPRGTPIIASGNGTVEKAGWTGGYGRQTILRHANGYKSSYSHQSTIAKGVVAGARVRQGQVIGYVGSTGLSSGNHLHYELIVNGKKVDPMRVRLPNEKSLSGEELEVFQRERERIDMLLKDDDGAGTKMAAVKLGR